MARASVRFSVVGAVLAATVVLGRGVSAAARAGAASGCGTVAGGVVLTGSFASGAGVPFLALTETSDDPASFDVPSGCPARPPSLRDECAVFLIGSGAAS